MTVDNQINDNISKSKNNKKEEEEEISNDENRFS